MEVIVPAAGLSTRFPGMKPKYLLFDYKGELMLKNAVSRYLNKPKVKVTVGILKEHDEMYESSTFIRRELPDVNVVILENRTKGPADTVYQILKQIDSTDDSLLIKDCDSFFDHDYSDGNFICVSNISQHKTLKRLSSKSFVLANNQGIINNIIEKNVVSDTFCVGAYKFESVKLFVDSYENMGTLSEELYVSHVIQQCLMKGNIFQVMPVRDYVDVGTFEDWHEFNDRPVMFCDIDGTLIHAQSRYGKNSYDKQSIVLDENCRLMLEYQAKGAQIIFTTSRPKDEYTYAVTDNMLRSLGFKNYTLLMGLNNSRRILINDYNESNPFPRAEAVNIRRNSDNLNDFLK